jgi:hypothetical protein
VSPISRSHGFTIGLMRLGLGEGMFLQSTEDVRDRGIYGRDGVVAREQCLV